MTARLLVRRLKSDLIFFPDFVGGLFHERAGIATCHGPETARVASKFEYNRGLVKHKMDTPPSRFMHSAISYRLACHGRREGCPVFHLP
jgi:hypothetical protein